MSRMVQCQKLGRELPGMSFRPFKGPLGERIFQSISFDAWKQWVEHSKMLVNEYRLDLTSPQGQAVMLEQAERFFFGDGGAKPAEYKSEGEGGQGTGGHGHGH